MIRSTPLTDHGLPGISRGSLRLALFFVDALHRRNRQENTTFFTSVLTSVTFVLFSPPAHQNQSNAWRIFFCSDKRCLKNNRSHLLHGNINFEGGQYQLQKLATTSSTSSFSSENTWPNLPSSQKLQKTCFSPPPPPSYVYHAVSQHVLGAIIRPIRSFIQDPLEAILVIFGRRALIFLFLFESSWKIWKMTPLLCACAVVITLETQKCRKKAPRSFKSNFFY